MSDGTCWKCWFLDQLTSVSHCHFQHFQSWVSHVRKPGSPLQGYSDFFKLLLQSPLNIKARWMASPKPKTLQNPRWDRMEARWGVGGGGIKQGGTWIKLLQSLKTTSLLSQTVPEELQNGRGFGYVVAFRPYGKMIWMLTVLASADASRYVFRNESVRPFSPFEVKVGVFNNKGEGPFSPTTVVYSAEEGTMLLQFQDVDFIYLFIYLWLLWVFVAACGLSRFREQGQLSGCGVRASHCRCVAFSSCWAWALGCKGFSSCCS